MPSYVTPKKATEFVFSLGLPSVASPGQFQANPTLAAGDVRVSKDGGAFANISSLPTVSPASGKLVQVTLSSTEMDADNVAVLFSDASGSEWDDIVVNIQTTAQQIDDLASQASVDSIGAASGGALNFAASEDNTGGAIIDSVTFVGTQTNTYTSTEAEDGTLHTIDDATNAFDIVYGFQIGGGRTAAEVTFKGYLSGSNDSASIQVYDHVGSSWDTIQTLTGKNATTNDTIVIPLLAKHTGSGSELGKVYIRFVTSGQSNPQLNIDQLLVAAVNIGLSVGYALGAVWIDTNLSNTNTESFVDGVADNPVSTVAAAQTIASAIGLKTLKFATGSSVTLSASLDGFIVKGDNYVLALGGQSISGSIFESFGPLSGTATAATPPIFNGGPVGNVTIPPAVFLNAGFTGPFTANGAGNYLIANCHSEVAGSGSPSFDFSGQGGTTNVSFRKWSGGVSITIDSDCTVSIDIISGGTVTVNGTGGSVNIRGMVEGITDNSGGSVTITQNAAFSNDRLAEDFLGATIEGTTTLQQSAQLWNAAAAGKLSGAGGTNVKIRDLADSKDRIDATVDATGNRTSVTRNYD